MGCLIQTFSVECIIDSLSLGIRFILSSAYFYQEDLNETYYYNKKFIIISVWIVVEDKI